MLINAVLSNFYGNDIGHAGQDEPFIHFLPHTIYISIRFARSKNNIMQIMWLSENNIMQIMLFLRIFLRIFGRDSWWKRLAGTKGRSRQSPLPTDDRRSG